MVSEIQWIVVSSQERVTVYSHQEVEQWEQNKEIVFNAAIIIIVVVDKGSDIDGSHRAVGSMDRVC